MNSHFPPRELLESTHSFPCRYTFKVIGASNEAFVQGIVEAVRRGMEIDFDPPYESRETKAGRHISLTFEPIMENPDQIMSVYAELQKADGVILLL